MPLFLPALPDWSNVGAIKLKTRQQEKLLGGPLLTWKLNRQQKQMLNLIAGCFRLDEGDESLPTSERYNFLLLSGSEPFS